MKNVIRIAIAAAAAGLGTSAVQAGHYEDLLIREAHRVVSFADQLKRETSIHFRHTSEYRHLLNDAAKIRCEAEHIDRLSHRVRGISDLRHIRADIVDLDKLVHHVAELIEDINNGHYCGRTRGNARHVERLVANMNRSLHSMERLVDEMERRFSRSTRPCRNAVDVRIERRPAPRYERRPAPRCETRSVGEQIATQVLFDIFGRRH